MRDYEGLVKSLRICADSADPISECCFSDCCEHDEPIDPLCMGQLIHMAADAIEELSKKCTGVWITPRKNYCKCSVCGAGFHHSVGDELDNYCAECGAKMKGKIEMRKIDTCPYCGCEEAYVESYEHHVGATRYRVCCPKCGVYLDSGYWQTADRAIEAWNNRSNSMWWLPTAKQKPFNEYGEGKSVLTVDTLGLMRIAEYVGGVWQTPDGEPITNTKVFPITHWMPLPEPPKEEKE